MLFDQLQANREKILALANQHGLSDVRIFGSVARGEETAESDIDFLVHPCVGANAFHLIRFKRDVEEMMQRQADVVSDRGLYPLLREEILQSAKSL